MIGKSNWSFFYIPVIALCITRGADAQEAPSPAQSAPMESQGEEVTAGEMHQLVPSQSEQHKQDSQSKKTSEATTQEKNDEQTTSDAQTKRVEQTETPQVVTTSQPQAVSGEKQTQGAVSHQKASYVDTAPPSNDNREAAEARIGLGLEIDTVWNTDPGFDLFSEDDVSTQVGVWFSYDLLQITENLILAGEAGLGIGGAENQPQENLDLTWSMNSFKVYVAANLRVSAFSWMQPHIKLAGGASFGTIEFQLRDEGPLNTVSENTTSPLGTIGAGVTFQTPTRMFESSSGAFASLSLGLLIEAGYTLASSMSLTLKTDRDEDPIENRTAQLGELDLSGPYIRTCVLARF